ncbi:MAG: patatin-like phospholipase family protein [Odoribacteraceae bacterium]|nr:patatin-like phospholipase family protein [Odoribacteraceae bacterium]
MKFNVRALLLLLLLLPSLPGAVARERKKVGLVLSGGGAKGMAHIGVLKVLEEAGIPVDVIVGTSMGAIVGGLYAIGYDAPALDSIARLDRDWMFLLSDKVYRHDQPFPEKEKMEKYLVSMPVWRRAFQVPPGFVSGQNIYNLFMDLTIGYHDSTRFDRLPVPFACVASNLVNGQEVVLDRGSLALAMRASMAMPGIFAPVIHDGMVLADGGISNNLPADVALALGADVLIGVDVQSRLKEGNELESIIGIVNQLISFLGLQKYEENVRLLDLHLCPDVSSYPATGFSPEAIAGLIERGEAAARGRWKELQQLKREIFEGASPDEVAPVKERRRARDRSGIRVNRVVFEGCDARDERWLRAIARVKPGAAITREDIHRAIARLYGTGNFARVDFRLSGDPFPDLIFSMEGKPASSLDVGFRFDSEEMAAILLNTTLARARLRGSRLSLTGRLSVNPYVTLDYSLGNTFLHRLGLSYTFKYNDLSFYNKGIKSDNVSFRYHRADARFSNLWLKNFNLQAGARYEYYDYRTRLSVHHPGDSVEVKPEGLFSYYLQARVETFDKRYYPTRGFSLRLLYALCTDNLYSYGKGPPFSVLEFACEPVISLTRRVKMLPALYGRVLIGDKVAGSMTNYAGGMVFGRYFSWQIPFAGIQRLEPVEKAVVVARLQLRYRLGIKHYLSLVGNHLVQDNHLFDLPGGHSMTGGALGYSYDSMIGPLGVDFTYSGWTRRVGAYFNIGYYF